MLIDEFKWRVPRTFERLNKPSRYKGLYGGRGGGKSHHLAERLIIRCFEGKIRAACIREVQVTIRDSVRQLLVDKIQKFGLGEFFEVQQNEIRGQNGSLIVFKGMQAYNAENIKSLEDFDIAWVEEAQTLSEKSLRLLRPTIRKEGSEIWFSWNPRYESDAIDEFLRGANPPEDAIVIKINLEQNPFATSVLLKERDEDYARDAEMARHVWGGDYEIVSEGAYYARLITKAEDEGRIGHFPHVPSMPVRTAWDIGVDDYTAIWFIQDDGVFHTVIDYYEVSGLGAEDIVRQALPELLPDLQERAEQRLLLGRSHPFRYAMHYLPHDVANREWGAGARSRVETLIGFGVKPIERGAAMKPDDRINAARALLPMVRFDRTPRVMLGMNRLRRYARKRNEQMGIYMGPLHDENSHGADAFGEYAVNRGKHFIRATETKLPANPGAVLLQGPPTKPKGTRLKV
jgi:phage terminase large subunit